MLTIGIDAGLTGAIATLDERGDFRYLADLPVATRRSVKWIDGAELLTMLFAARHTNQPARVFVEYMHAFPLNRSGDTEESGAARGNNLHAASMKGAVLGSILAILQVAELPYELIVPQSWKRALELMMPKASYQERKLASLVRARELFPKADLARTKDHGRAEALLIAYYGHKFVAKRDLFGEKAA